MQAVVGLAPTKAPTMAMMTAMVSIRKKAHNQKGYIL